MVWCGVMNVMLQALAGEVLHWWCGMMNVVLQVAVEMELRSLLPKLRDVHLIGEPVFFLENSPGGGAK